MHSYECETCGKVVEIGDRLYDYDLLAYKLGGGKIE